MAHEQFFFSQNINRDILRFEHDEHHHLSRVLRKKVGDIIWGSNGDGMAYETKIISIAENDTNCKIINAYSLWGEPQNRVSLAVGIIKPSHWEIMLEKSVELGVYEIFPLITRYTVKTGIKRERNENIILSAVKQCGRSRIPILHEPMQYSEFIQIKRSETMYICDNQDDYPSLEAGSDQHNYMVLIGPEGGFHSDEVAQAITNSCQSVLLSNRRLRTETACLMALSRLVV
ncbi:MAG: 16S rRNA (uracil(1498)-N(3))-methyltransferase [Candidatus Marinimicrobia bacterium]|nr:16S rRNA (uracil(1498)-N(3))-methyltransferase [Candidatus Neomarinimicrobiota bacterium]